MGIILDADVVIRGEKGTFDLETWLLSQFESLGLWWLAASCRSRR